jgi:hypothetical protein
MLLEHKWWKYLLGLWMTLVIIGAFLYAPPAEGLGETARIIFFHVPMAWLASFAFLISATSSIQYLRTRDNKYDIWAVLSGQKKSGSLIGIGIPVKHQYLSYSLYTLPILL